MNRKVRKENTKSAEKLQSTGKFFASFAKTLRPLQLHTFQRASSRLSVVGFQLSVVSYQLSVISYQLSVISYQLSVVSLSRYATLSGLIPPTSFLSLRSEMPGVIESVISLFSPSVIQFIQ